VIENYSDEAQERLMATSEQFRKLAAEHTSHERRIEELGSRRYLTEEEQLEEARLKKEKLHLKDQMEHIVHEGVLHSV
jgi:uncharacterized protein YdcH (DUF465 family)